MTLEHLLYLEYEFDTQPESLIPICKLEKKFEFTPSPMEVKVEDIDFSVQVSFAMPLDL